MKEYVEYDGVVTNDEDTVVHKFKVGVFKRAPTDDAELPPEVAEIVCWSDIDDAIGHVVASKGSKGHYKVWVKGECRDEFDV